MVGLVHVIGSRVRLAGTSEAELAVTDEIRLRWKSWIDGYRYAVGSGRPDGLLAIGQEMLRWLDSTGWAAHWLAHPGARELEIVGDSPETADQQRVLALPWELLATGQGFLAADGVQPFVVWRRIGRQCAPVPAEHCDLSVLFMAASPDAAGSGLRISDLDYEAEEAAILAASRPTALNMAVEESGCVEFLRDRLSGEELFEVLHLSCHGTVLKPDEAAPLSRFGAQPGPALVLESAVGAVEFVSPADLAGAWADRVPGLVFLSACRTAEADGSAVESFARALVRAVPAVLGWDGSVYDHDAIAFSSSLYDGLSRFEPPAFAAAVARRELLRKHLADPASGAHWHLARVWVGAGGGGPLCVRTGERRRFARNAGVQAFLDVKNQRVPVASPEEFVGRRRELQQVLRAFRADSAPGVVIHGMGNLGKSSLAARIASRLPDLRTVVIVDDYDPLAVFDRIVAAVPADSRRDVSEKWRQRIAGDDELLADAVEDILDNALRSHPILLVVDDLEQALEIPSPGQQLVPVRQDHGWRSAIVSLIRAFGERGRSRLLFTTRYDFEALDSRGRDLASRLVRVALTPFNARQQDKQLHAALLARRPADATMRAVAALTCDEVTARAMAAARGNPGLQNLLTTRILTGEIDAAVAAIESIEAYVHCEDTAGVTDQVSSNSTVDFFRRMAFERYRQALTDDEAEALRTLLLIGSGAWPAEVDAAALERLPLGEIPVPLSVAQALAARAGVSDPGRAVQRLVSLGLVDSYSDRIGLGGEGVAVNPLARPLVEQLGAQDTVLLAEAAMTHLASAWCHPSSTRWPVDARSLEATRLALLAGDAARSQSAALATVNYLFDNLGTAVAACAALAVSVAALDLALRTGVAPDLILLRRASEIATRIGDAEARRHLNEISQEPGPGEDLGARAGLDATRADDLATRGKVDSAMALLRGASTTFEQIGDTRSRAVTMGKIADILTQQGQVVEALRIYREEQLPVYERIGDTRERAVTMGKIADILTQQGQVVEALRIRREEQLPVYERIGDTRSRAVTMGKIADILTQQGQVVEALRIRREEQLPVYERIGDTRERAVTMGKIADILTQQGQVVEALRIRREEELPVYERIGDTRSRALTMGKIADILTQQGQVVEALRIRREEELPVYERIGDTRSRALTMGKIADILTQQGQVVEALRIRREEELPVYERIGDTRERAVTMGQIADILTQQGQVVEALRIYREEQLPVYERIGDTRSRAVTMGKIADILARQGQVVEALSLWLEALPVFESIQEPFSIGFAAIRIAQLQHFADEDSAARISLDKAESAFSSVDNADGVAACQKLRRAWFEER